MLSQKNFIRFLLLVFFLRISIDTRAQKNYLPDFYSAQYAGYFGLISVGFGEQYLGDRIGTGFYYGYTPPHVAGTEVHIFALKNTFYSKKQYQIGFFQLIPTLNASVLVETGKNSELFLSSKYPKGYYRTNSFHIPLSIGIAARRFFLEERRIESLEYGFEIITLANYLYYIISSGDATSTNILSLALTLKIKI